MDCTTASNTSAMLKQDDNTDERNCSGGVANNDGVEQQINKAVTSSSNPKQPGQDEQQPIQQPYIGIVTTKVLKGKRTKRQRLHSSESFSSTYNHQETDDLILAENEEQLDLANCLILLAQGQSRPSPPPALSSIIRNGSSIFTKLSGNKRSSSSLNMEGIYECKTCNRTFSSFQALGGHRASHNKLNISTSHQNLLISPAINPNTPSPLSLQLGNINYGCSVTSTSTTSAIIAQSNNFKSINKIHECSICGAEFSSGQALGGHMRRHRGPVIPQNSSAPITNTTTANTTLSLSNAVDVISAATAGKVERISNNNEFLSLDLNLPASPSPEDTKYSLPPKQQSTGLLFSTTPALVDCFY